MEKETRLPAEFSAAGFSAGLKQEGPDMALILSRRPAAAAGVFTRNRVRAACVELNEQLIRRQQSVRAVLANSGNANACTGERGAADARALSAAAAETAGCSSEEVLQAATGVIGVPLPLDAMRAALAGEAARPAEGSAGFEAAARAIMTTDTVPKTASARISIAGRPVTVTGMAKGSGMIHPDMATMLAFIFTDAEVPRQLLQESLQEAADRSFNMISVDGDTSTNDMVLALANGASGAEITEPGSEEERSFRRALRQVSEGLAVAIAADGEGATKLIIVKVRGAGTLRDARLLARGVVSSNLVKAAFFGEDANWGRIMAAMGRSGADFDPAGVTLEIASTAGSVEMLQSGSPVDFDEQQASSVLAEREITVNVSCTEGQAGATAWGCDLSHDYVTINGSYRS